MSSENQAVAAALEKHEKDKISKNVVIKNLQEVLTFIILYTHKKKKLNKLFTQVTSTLALVLLMCTHSQYTNE